MQRSLLLHLISAQRERRWAKPNATGARILWDFYVAWAESKGKPRPKRNDVTARHTIKQLREALEKYYLKSAGEADSIQIEIPSGTRLHYQPRISYRENISAKSSSVEFEYIGKSKEALAELTRRIPHARLIEDTTVRWSVAESSYDDTRAYIEALKQSEVKFRWVTGPVRDKKYANALKEAFSDRSERITCFQLYRSSPLMNFALIYDKDSSTPEVLFGYGTQSRYQLSDETPVFRSSNELLVKEFQRLFRVLCDRQFSRQISLDGPDSLPSSEHACDVLATFERFPDHEIREKIQACRAKAIIICTTAWPTFDSFRPALKEALRNGCSVDLALWKADTPFIRLRSESGGHPDDIGRLIEANKVTLESFRGEAQFKKHWCTGQASVTIFWIDDLIYFSPYWANAYASHGPHFLVYAESATGEYLRKQYLEMLLNSDDDS